MSEDASKTLVQAFVSCRLDYCNSLFFRMSEGLMYRGCSRFRTPPPVWCLVLDVIRLCSVSCIGCRYARASTSRLRCSFVGRCLAFRHRTYPTTAVLSPMFASDDYVPQLPNMRCDVDTYCTFGDRGFAAAGLGLWNYLPSHAKDADLSYNRFRRSLKTFLFG